LYSSINSSSYLVSELYARVNFGVKNLIPNESGSEWKALIARISIVLIPTFCPYFEAGYRFSVFWIKFAE